MNIVLIGMRGSGKTATGKLLAIRLGKSYIETDDLIAQKAGLSIMEIVDKYGWERFRDLETEITHSLATVDNAIIATGGGIITREENIRELKRIGKLIWLQASVDTLAERIGEDDSRPSLTGKPLREDLETVMAGRHEIYKRECDIAINTEDRSPEEIAEIISALHMDEK